MGAKLDAAINGHRNGMNCGQAVLAAFCGDYGLDAGTAMKLACGLGNGFRSGELCGAAAAAALVSGLKYGNASAQDKEARKICYAGTRELLAAFEERNGALTCRELLKIKAEKGGTCADLVKSAAEILEEYGY